MSKTEEYNRPNHADFKDSFELAREKFSGVRHNSISHYVELWIDGEIRGSVPEGDQAGFEKLYAEIFALGDARLT